MKRIMTILFMLSLFKIGIAQNSSQKQALLNEIAHVEAEIEKEKELQWKFYNDQKVVQVCKSKTIYTEFKPVSQEEFIMLCNTPLKNLKELQNQFIDYSISYSCFRDRDKEKIVQNFCFEAVGVGDFNKVVIREPEEIYYNSDFKKNEQITANIVSADVQQKLGKIANTKKMYQDLIVTLDDELWNNTVEIVDNSSNLLVKHVPVGTDEMQQIQKRAMEELRNSTGVTALPIDNKVADVVDLIVDNTEKIVELIPSGDKITNHYLWKLFKSTPEAGKILGHIGTEINIYFRKNEYQKKIEALEQEEQRLLNINNKY